MADDATPIPMVAGPQAGEYVEEIRGAPATLRDAIQRHNG
jgi:hypothetical protein